MMKETPLILPRNVKVAKDIHKPWFHFNDQMHKIIRSTGKPHCYTCAKKDYDRNELKAPTEYSKMKFTETRRFRIRDHKTGLLTDWVMIAYKCPEGHGSDIQFYAPKVNPAGVPNEPIEVKGNARLDSESKGKGKK